jgi:malonate decarboxylase alpha subunit
MQAMKKHSWKKRLEAKEKRIEQMQGITKSRIIPTNKMVQALETLIQPGDRVVLEGNNQKQASFLSAALAKVDPGKLYDLHMIMSSISRPEHLDLFEYGIANKVDFSYAGPQSLRIAQMLEDGKLTMGEIHMWNFMEGCSLT